MSTFLSNWRQSPSQTYALLNTTPNQPHATHNDLDPISSSDLDINTQKLHASWSHKWRNLRLTSFLLLAITTMLKSLRYLVPSYITSLSHRLSHHRKPQFDPPSRPLSKTAYLDGLRGVAALVVYIFHFSYLWFPFLRNGYGSSPSDTLFLQMPVVRVLHSGRASVTIFFVISGFVLTLRTLVAIHLGNGDKILDGLAGSLFRRPFRLYLPILVSTGMAAVLVRFNFYAPENGGDIPPRPGTWTEQVGSWLEVTERMVSPFYGVTGRQNLWGSAYNGHLWTIPVEFKGSLQVFLWLLAFSRSKRWVHVLGVVVAGWWQVVKGDFDQTLFCVGLLLSELGLVLSGSDGWVVEKVSGRVRHLVTMGVFVFSMHLMSYPESGGPSSPGFRTFSKVVPGFYQGNEERIQQFWISVGSIFFILALMYSPSVSGPWRRWLRREGADGGGSIPEMGDEPLLQKLFTNGFAQYLGHISYSLYLWHGAINTGIGLRLLNPALTAWKGVEAGAAGLVNGGFNDEAASVLGSGWKEYMWKWAGCFFLNTFVLFWVSDLFHRGVDVYAVRLTRSLSTWAMASK